MTEPPEPAFVWRHFFITPSRLRSPPHSDFPSQCCRLCWWWWHSASACPPQQLMANMSASRPLPGWLLLCRRRKSQRTDTIFTVKPWPILLDHYKSRTWAWCCCRFLHLALSWYHACLLCPRNWHARVTVIFGAELCARTCRAAFLRYSPRNHFSGHW